MHFTLPAGHSRPQLTPRFKFIGLYALNRGRILLPSFPFEWVTGELVMVLAKQDLYVKLLLVERECLACKDDINLTDSTYLL